MAQNQRATSGMEVVHGKCQIDVDIFRIDQTR